MDWKKDIVDSHYQGDTAQFKTEFADAVTEGRLNAVCWEDFVADATTLTHLKDTGRGVIEINLGYLPPDDVMLPYEPYLRALTQMYWQNALSEEDFMEQVEDHIKLIRKADMKYNTYQKYDKAIYQNYWETFTPYGYAVKERLTSFLGYVPKLEHSLIAELWMRDIMADDTYKLPEGMTAQDIRAMTLVKYREVLLEKGQEAADSSPLLSEYIVLP